MNWNRILVIVFSLLACLPVCPQGLRKQTFSPEQHLGYKPIKAALAALASVHKNKAGLQHFCVIGYQSNRFSNQPPSKIVWVHWKEQNRLIYWEPAAAGLESKTTLIHSRRQIDLTNDVVETQAEVGSSSYLVARDWVNSVLKDCRKSGVNYVLRSK
jgi:hypothetical protein